MPILDVSDALEDILLQDVFSVLRRSMTVNIKGRSVTTNVRIDGIVGVVYATGDNSLDRREEAQKQRKRIGVITKFSLRSVSVDVLGQSYQPDVVLWNGNSFLVNELEDYSLYGQGYIYATCDLLDMQSVPSQTGAIIVSVAGKLTLFVPSITAPATALLALNVLPANMIVFRNGLPQFSPGDYSASVDGSGNTTMTFVIPWTTAELQAGVNPIQIYV